jgi:hypothetical protein
MPIKQMMLAVAASVAVHGYPAFAEGEHYMKIDSEWQLGKVIKDGAGTEEFVTCPGNQHYPIDRDNIVPASDPCSGDSGAFGVLQIMSGQGTYAVVKPDGTVEEWHLPQGSQLSPLSPGTNVYLDVIDRSKKLAEPYEVLLQTPGTIQ